MKTPRITTQSTIAILKRPYGFLRQDALSSEVIVKARKYTQKPAQAYYQALYFRPTELIIPQALKNKMVGAKFDHFFG